jgi:glucose uptake protein GlcU
MTRSEAEQRCSEIADSRAALAERPAPPRWYYPAYGVMLGGMIAWTALPWTWVKTVVVIPWVLGMIWLQGTYRDVSALADTSVPRGRPLGWLIALLLVLVGLLLAGVALQHVWGWVGPVLAGIVAVPVVIVGGRRYDAAVRADERGRA